MHTKFYSEVMKEGLHARDLCVYGRLLLQRILEACD
jgi:hypothetical protein